MVPVLDPVEATTLELDRGAGAELTSSPSLGVLVSREGAVSPRCLELSTGHVFILVTVFLFIFLALKFEFRFAVTVAFDPSRRTRDAVIRSVVRLVEWVVLAPSQGAGCALAEQLRAGQTTPTVVHRVYQWVAYRHIVGTCLEEGLGEPRWNIPEPIEDARVEVDVGLLRRGAELVLLREEIEAPIARAQRVALPGVGAVMHRIRLVLECEHEAVEQLAEADSSKALEGHDVALKFLDVGDDDGLHDGLRGLPVGGGLEGLGSLRERAQGRGPLRFEVSQPYAVAGRLDEERLIALLPGLLRQAHHDCLGEEARIR